MMVPGPEPDFRTSLRRNPDDPRSLIERIDAQIAERIGEAVDLAALRLLVELRKRDGRPLPEAGSARDRDQFERLVRKFLQALRDAIHAELPPDQRAALEAAESRTLGSNVPERLLAGQVHLARRQPDYWQRFEAHARAYHEAHLAQAPPAGWIQRLLG
jgi:hypothetical protein